MILNPERLIAAGYVKKTHGIDGGLRLYVDAPFQELLTEASFLFLELDGDHVPFRIEELKGEEDAPIVRFAGVASPETAAELVNAALYIERSLLPGQFDENPVAMADHSFLIGYRLYDVGLGLIGTIEDIEVYPQQELAVVHFHEKSHLVPLHPDLVAALDEGERTITMDLPEGFFEA